MKKASSELLLLDVNVLVAMAWPNHQFHERAVAALAAGNPWATCALTQLGFIRLSSNRAVIPTARTPQEAASILEGMVADSMHRYLEDLPAPVSKEWCDTFAGLLGHQQVTDAYLLKLAAAHDAVLVTFDARIQSLAGNRQRVRVVG